jgi:hypothetical protein
MTKNDLIGTWRFVEFRLINEADGSVTRPWGDDHSGQIVYAPDGFMSVLLRRNGSVMAYCGPYDVEADAVVHRITISTDDKLIGTAQRRLVQLDGKRLTLTSEVSLFGGKGTQAKLVWERMA